MQENASEELQVVQTHLLNSIEEAAQYLGQKLPQSGVQVRLKMGNKI
ncbi:hypothetical protein NWO25_16280 [Enterococcus lactis]|nr:hypothetical protein [Enterococcus lactis]